MSERADPGTLNQAGSVLQQEIVLVDERDRMLGRMPKAQVHSDATPLHRAFSCYLFNTDGYLLVTRRAHGKTFEDVWTNSVCGHPAPEEPYPTAAVRRAREELALTFTDLRIALPTFSYRARDTNGILENEVCPVLVGRVTEGTDAKPDPAEASATAWLSWDRVLHHIRETPQRCSPWAREQVPLLDAWGGLDAYITPTGERRASATHV